MIGLRDFEESLKTVLEMRATLYQQMLTLEDSQPLWFMWIWGPGEHKDPDLGQLEGHQPVL